MAEDINQLLKVRREKLQNLQEAGKDPFKITKCDVTHHSMEIKNNYDELEGKTVTIAGRMMFKRVMGKASFCNTRDLEGDIQAYVARDNIGEDSYKDFKKYDVGDLLCITGEVFKTKTGEISIHASNVTLLSKSLQILPEKFHGLTDTDVRYRQRYVDLIMNAEVKDTFIKRSRIISTIRKYLDGEGFMEVETPMLVANAGGAAARPFETHFNALDEDFKLRISLELYLKRLIVGGMEKVYEIGRVFRNEGLDTRHNPEFTLMELYQAYTDYHGMMDLTENLYRYVAQEVLGTTKITYNGIEMDLGKPFERLTMVDAVKKYADVDFNEISTLEEAQAIAKEKGIEFEEYDGVNSFATLLKAVNKIDGIERIRFISPHPKDFTEDVIEAIRDCEKVCKIIHLPLQSGSTEILKRMNRKYTKEQYLALVEKMKARIPGIVLSTDIIVGFPGETEEDFEDTLDVVSKVHFEQVYMFIYSRRVGTPADKMENQVPDEVKHERFDRLKKLAESQIAGNNQKYVNTIQKVLVEGKSKTNENMLTGRTDTNKVVNFEGTEDMIGKIVNLKIVSEHMWYLKGKEEK